MLAQSFLTRLISASFLFGSVALSIPQGPTSPRYSLRELYKGLEFFDKFHFFSAPDPTHGFVKYVDRDTAQARGLIAADSNMARMNVDSSTVFSRSDQGRYSVRIESKNRYTRGLFVADVRHMPGQACGAWPAFWTLGSGAWPFNGEIDIIEGVNRQAHNLILLHTGDQCSIHGQGQLGTLYGTDCAVSSSPVGCGVTIPDTRSYGDAFNSIGGGVYAMEWTSGFIKVWFFPRGAIPETLYTDSPDVSQLGTPQANFQGACNIDEKFKEHRLIFDTTFCGDFAGNTYQQSGCPMYGLQDQMQACVQYVAENPAAYTQAYWEIDSIRIFQ